MTAPRASALDADAAAVTAAVAGFRTDLDRLLGEIGRRLVGQGEVAGAAISALLAGGHVLLEGVPGLGKTLLVRTAAAALDLTFSRVQFTPDLMPADVIGTNLIVDDSGGRRFEFQQGPIFAHVVLADEINRATPKTQSALLEAMQEQSVTVGKQTYPLPPPFFVLATQNPIEMEGTYPLPEAQLDRFLFKLRVDSPSGADLHPSSTAPPASRGGPPGSSSAASRLLEMRALVRQVPVARPVQDFVVRLVEATHPARSPLGEVKRFVRYGSSPRGAQAMHPGGQDRGAARGAVRAVLRRRPSGGDPGAAPPRAAELRRRGGRDHRRRARREAARRAAGDAVSANEASRRGPVPDGPRPSQREPMPSRRRTAATARTRFDERFLRQLESLALTIRRTAAGRSPGSRRGRRVGAGLEFADHRDYVPGDDLRYLDWNLYGRLERLRAAPVRRGRGFLDRRPRRRQRLDGDRGAAQARPRAAGRRRRWPTWGSPTSIASR